MVGKKNDLKEVDKGRIIQYLELGYTTRDIGNRFGVSAATVMRYRRKYEEHGNVDRKHGSGRPKKTTTRIDRAIVNAVTSNRDISGKELLHDLEFAGVSERTIRRRISACSEFKTYWKNKKPFISDDNRDARVKWAQDHLHWTTEDWCKVMWTDESPYVLRYAKRTRVWRLHNERYKPWATKPQSNMIKR